MEKEALRTTRWKNVRLGDVLQVIRGVSFPKDAKRDYFSKHLVACLRTANVQKEVEWDDLWFVEEKYISREEQYIKPNDILISTANSLELLGKVAIVKHIPNNATLGTFIVSVRTPKELNSKWVYHYLSSMEFRIKVQENASTTTNISNISTGKLKEIEIPISPLSEQYRIVTKLEELFSELDKGVESLKTAQQQLKVYRQAVLKWAFEGKLTEKRRNSDWKWITLGEFTEDIKIGPFGTLLHEKDYVFGGIPVVNPKHIRHQRIYPDPKVSVSVEKAKELSSYILKENDVILGRRGEMGRSAYVTNKENGWICGTGSVIIRLKNKNNAKLYSLILTEKRVKDYLEKNCTGTTMKNLNEKIVRNVLVPIIGFQEQHQIVQEVESRLSVCDKMEETIEHSLTQAEALRQSILKKAFEGKLVPQNPNDEPAEKLLERIRAERKAQQPEKKPTKKRKRK